MESYEKGKRGGQNGTFHGREWKKKKKIERTLTIVETRIRGNLLETGGKGVKDERGGPFNR